MATNGKRPILVVDDDVDIREVMAEILEDAGHRVLKAANGKEALDLLQSGKRPALIFLDLMMPVLSGPELLELLQSDQNLADLPVVVVSAFADSGEAPGVKRFVQKPVSASTLRDLVAEYAG
jgi:two-component system, OmpR family, response regulator CpxR